jgi:hypothetical protein
MARSGLAGFGRIDLVVKFQVSAFDYPAGLERRAEAEGMDDFIGAGAAVGRDPEIDLQAACIGIKILDVRPDVDLPWPGSFAIDPELGGVHDRGAAISEAAKASIS